MDLSKLVIEYKFDFWKIAEVMGMSEYDVREMWTEIHLKRKKRRLRKKPESLEPNKRIILTLEPKHRHRKPFEEVVRYFRSLKSQNPNQTFMSTDPRKTFEPRIHNIKSFLPEINSDHTPILKNKLKSETERLSIEDTVECPQVIRKKFIVFPQKHLRSPKNVVFRHYKENICVCMIKAHVFIPFLQIVSKYNLEILHGQLGELTIKVLLRLDEIQNSGTRTQRNEAHSRKFINYMKGNTYSVLIHGPGVIQIMHEELPKVPQNTYYHCSASQRHAILERGLIREEDCRNSQENKYELACVVAPCAYIASEFYADFFQVVFRMKFDIFKFKIDSFDQLAIQEYCRITNRYVEELSESLFVVALEAQNAFYKTKELKREFPWLLISQSAEKGAQEVALFFF